MKVKRARKGRRDTDTDSNASGEGVAPRRSSRLRTLGENKAAEVVKAKVG